MKEEDALSESYLTNHRVATSDKKRDERVSLNLRHQLIYNTYSALNDRSRKSEVHMSCFKVDLTGFEELYQRPEIWILSFPTNKNLLDL